MKSNEVSTMIFEALEYLAPIKTPLVDMLSGKNIYGRPPFLRFRFDIPDENDELYIKVENIISNYHGKLKWILIRRKNNYFLMPFLLSKYIDSPSFLKQGFLSHELGEFKYKEIIDQAIDDIPLLASLIIEKSNISGQ
ncbi:hypothetical protein [Flammeovirga sp. SJP92]|uniref:hypothetical protein n=1 Tax=Flammeovirga sp. SJP92 TaxID=1775430 RepID=UPI0007872769|nr:hypothetical protein [Flammeovirga sp. SJP92]KXX69164.1 hypothetical protein AVL50_16695 [Flammeovirga sp. SJP92]